MLECVNFEVPLSRLGHTLKVCSAEQTLKESSVCESVSCLMNADVITTGTVPE